MIELKKQTISETFSIYFDKRMLKILLLGAISGFPWVLIGSSLSLWLKEDGLSRSTIGWAKGKLIARAGAEISDLQAKEYGLKKETKAKAQKENKAK